MLKLIASIFATIVLLSLPIAAQDNKTSAPPTLADKAVIFDTQIKDRFLWNGELLVRIVNPPNGTGTYADSWFEDNPIWQGCLLAAVSWRYAAEKNPKDLEYLRELFQGMTKYRTVTGIPGVFARGYKPKDALRDHELKREYPKDWHINGDLAWVGDFSIDQLDGLLFGYAVYYDFAADDADKKAVAAEVDAIMSAIEDNGLTLRRFDGAVTTFGYFNPKYNPMPLDCLEILTFFKIAYHVTGKERYAETYRRLIDENKFHAKALNAKFLLLINHSDDNLAFQSFYNLIRLEEDQKLRELYLQALYNYWKTEKNELNSFFNFVYNAVVPEDKRDLKAIEDGIESLELFPPDKHLTAPDPTATQSLPRRKNMDGELETINPLPVNLRCTSEHLWSKNPYEVCYSNHPQVEHQGVDYLEAYWLGRYYGFVNKD